MYAPFFGLKRDPFSIAPDPRFLFMSEAHREALAHLLYGLGGGGGFVLLTGEIGAGKTTVCRCFLDQVPAHCDVAYVFNPKLGVTELLQTVCDEFHIAVPPGTATVKGYVDALNTFLLASHAAGRHSVLIIDEAQSLAPEVLEQLRLLTNLETAERKLLQIILIGQPELRQMLARPELEQLAQRVIARYHLPALSAAETAQYIRHRLAVAGLAREMPFDGRALARIHALCRGVPRRINLLADRALLGGYAGGKPKIDRHIVDQAAREVFGDESAAAARRPWPLAAAALGGAAVAAGLAVNWPPGAPAGRTAAVAAAAAPAASASSATAASAPSVALAASAPAAAASAADAAAVLAAALPSEAAAWRELAGLWKLELGDAEPCEAAVRQQIACFRASAALAQVRELQRPVLLTVRDERDHARYVLLTALNERSATVQAGGRSQTLSLWTLAGLWRGEFATFWRPPPGWREPYGDAPPPALANWMAERLPGPPEQPLKGRVVAFQVAHGLKPDGLAGPMTLMQINRASGIDEPRLAP
jgi:general secretion pathway protein A